MENLKGRSHLEDLGMDNIIKDFRETAWEKTDWIHLTEERGQWWALVNKEMNLWVP
jgi:hypothetical protein